MCRARRSVRSRGQGRAGEVIAEDRRAPEGNGSIAVALCGVTHPTTASAFLCGRLGYFIDAGFGLSVVRWRTTEPNRVATEGRPGITESARVDGRGAVSFGRVALQRGEGCRATQPWRGSTNQVPNSDARPSGTLRRGRRRGADTGFPRSVLVLDCGRIHAAEQGAL